MLKRLKTFVTLPSSIDIRCRHPALRAIEGWYQYLPDIPNREIQCHYQEWKESASNLKFTRWLMREKHVPNNVLSDIGKQLTSGSFKFSCRHNDLMRLADTPHYISCLRQQYRKQQLYFLADPDIAVCYIPDKAGKYLWRVLFRLVIDENRLALVAYRSYGNGQKWSIFRALEAATGLTIYEAVVAGDKGKCPMIRNFSSPTVHNNLILNKQLWNDHLVMMGVDKRITIWATSNWSL